MKNKKLINVISIALALLLIVTSAVTGIVLYREDGKDSIKQIVHVNGGGDGDTDADTDTDKTPDKDTDKDENPYGNDDITLGLDYTGDDEIIAEGQIDGSDICNLYVYNGSDPLCTNFRGLTSSVYHATEFMGMDPNNRDYTDEMIDLEFKRYKDAGFTHMRVQFKSDWMYSGDDSNPWDWECEKMLGFYEFCKKADEYGIQVCLVLGWQYPAFIEGGNASHYFLEVPYLMPRAYDENGNTKVILRWGTYFEELDYEEQNRRYADWGVQTVRALEAHGVDNAFNFFIFNEPREDGGSPTGAFVDYQKETFLALHKALKAEGLRDKCTLIGPNQSNTSGQIGLATAFMGSKGYDEIFDIYSSHYNKHPQNPTDDPYEYHYSLYSSFMEKVDGFGLKNVKEFWLDEFNIDGDHYMTDSFDDTWMGPQTATMMMAAFNAGVSAISCWQFFDQTWSEYYGSGGEYKYGTQIGGVVPSLYNTETPYPAYYALSLLSRYFGTEGGTTYNVEQSQDVASVYISALEFKEGGWSFAVVNMNTEAVTVNIGLEESIGGETLYRYQYSSSDIEISQAAKVITADKAFENVTKNIIDTVPGGSLTIYSTIENFG
ncbi:MAG: hypothetical protein IJ426_01535 [Clostridia bacterium]|nr:hypothetical protein [Clostridia bacterium]